MFKLSHSSNTNAGVHRIDLFLRWALPIVFLVFYGVGASPAVAENGAAIDSFAPPVVMPAGPFVGLPMDVSFRRPMVKLSAEQAAKYHPDPARGDVVIANFYHEGKFWIAKVPTAAVKRVYFLSERMATSVPAAHSELRFQFEPGASVELFPQEGSALPQTAKLTDFYTTTEAVMVPGDDFNLIHGIMDNFAVVTRAMSTEEMYFKSIYGLNRELRQIPIVWPKKDGKGKRIDPRLANGNTLRNAIDESDAWGLRKMYNTINTSCNTEALSFIDRATIPTGRHRMANWLHVLPIFPVTYLWARGLVPFWNLFRPAAPLFADEFAGFKNTASFPERRLAEERVAVEQRYAFRASGWNEKRGDVNAAVWKCLKTFAGIGHIKM